MLPDYEATFPDYVLKQQTKKDGLWISESQGPSTRYEIARVVRAGFLIGERRWAETLEGVVIYGIEANGKEWCTS